MISRNARQSLIGMLFIILTLLIFTVVNAMIKDFVHLYPMNEIVFFRFFFSLFPVAIIMYFQGGFQSFKTNCVPQQIGRAFLGTVGLGCIFYSFGHLPLANATSVSFAVVPFAALIAIPLLKEVPTRGQLLSILAGFAGVLIVAKPQGQDLISVAALIGILGAFIDSFTLTTGRYLTVNRQVSPGAASLYFAVTASVLTLVTLPFSFVMPDIKDFLMLALIGVLGGFGQYFLALGFTLATAVVASSMIYTAIVWSVLIDYFIWGDVPTVSALGGMLLIVVSGIIMAILQSRRAKDVAL